jgi:hypothetical protein
MKLHESRIVTAAKARFTKRWPAGAVLSWKNMAPRLAKAAVTHSRGINTRPSSNNVEQYRPQTNVFGIGDYGRPDSKREIDSDPNVPADQHSADQAPIIGH